MSYGVQKCKHGNYTDMNKMCPHCESEKRLDAIIAYLEKLQPPKRKPWWDREPWRSFMKGSKNKR